jgi:hypothetical protein
MLVVFELVYEFKLLVDVSIAVNLVNVDELNVFNEPVDVSIELSLPFALDVWELKSLLIEELALSKFVNLVNVDELNVFNEPVEV